ncbi:hypothetical protein HMPREF0083_02137 [Aneurinibacillus aneurinilyticus ATCC 12856]|uniref:Uncharacterized protein n=1 Tax=Aneurinibacillus aneurinilyticus ATCC 12856 TaxID=649747 RepID=U1YCG8_ANEAE|nr:hypothetical protein HMPREF0083_02137 [Aneurinibacillus aneurinilyticus ATCC 12856]
MLVSPYPFLTERSLSYVYIRSSYTYPFIKTAFSIYFYNFFETFSSLLRM